MPREYRRILRSPGVALALTTRDESLAAKLDERLGGFLDDGAADAELVLDAGKIPGVRWDADLQGRLDGTTVIVEQSGTRGAFDLARRSGRLTVSTDVDYVHNHVENALRMILVELAEQAGMRICHTAALADPVEETACLFYGPSGSGKTTSTEMALSRSWRPINDDLVFLGIEGDRVLVQGCAFHGRTKIRDFAHGRFPLTGIFRLVKADRHQATRLPLPDAVRELSRALVTWRPRTKAEQEAVLDFALAVSRRVPSFRLEFKKDPDFLEAARDGLR